MKSLNGSSGTRQRRSKPPRVTQKPTLPFDDLEIERILVAADRLADWGSFGPKLRAMVMLLRHSGLRIQDAACLERSRLKDDKLFLYTQKTGTPVNCPFQPETVKALEDLPNERPEYFFWDGKSERETTVKSWNRVFQKLFSTTELRLLADMRIDSATRSRDRCS